MKEASGGLHKSLQRKLYYAGWGPGYHHGRKSGRVRDLEGVLN